MLKLTEGAARSVAELRWFYEARDRPEAARNLRRALHQASDRIRRAPEAGLPAPRPYPDMARAGQAWIKEGRYWIAYSLAAPPVILAVVYDQANIPSRT